MNQHEILTGKQPLDKQSSNLLWFITPFIACGCKVLQSTVLACVHRSLTKILNFYIIFPKLFSKKFLECFYAHRICVVFEDKIFSETKHLHGYNSNLRAPYLSELPGEARHIR